MATYREIAFFALLALFGYLSYLVLSPFLGAVVLALLFAFLFHPIYRGLRTFLWDSLAAFVVLVIVLLCIVIPSVYLAGTLISEASGAYQAAQASGISVFDETSVADMLQHWVGIDAHDQLVEILSQGKSAIKAAIPGLVTRTGGFLLSLFIFFFVLYFALRDGASWFAHGIDALPLETRHREPVGELLRRQAKALLYGQILTSVLVGALIGGFFALFRIPNPVFWGFLMAILGILPMVGAFVVYVPASVYLVWQGQWVPGIVLFAASTAVHFFIDNILRPKLVSQAAEIHPAIVMLGALGGIALMGMVGFLVGPLILSFLVTILSLERAPDGSAQRAPAQERRKAEKERGKAQAT